MNKIDSAVGELCTLDALAGQDGFLNHLHPLAKLAVTISYLLLTASYPKYPSAGLLAMAVYPLVLFEISGLSIREALTRLRIVLPLVMAIGIANPFLDRQIVLHIGPLAVSAGVLSMAALMLKGCLCVLASYLLIATTRIEKICYALRKLHFPQSLVVEILLVHRYVTVFLKEASRVVTAYRLRAPGQKGIAISAWGPLLGQMLLRSMDRAQRVYQSMCLRGFKGEFTEGKSEGLRPKDLLWLLSWIALFVLLRTVPVLEWIGGWFV